MSVSCVEQFRTSKKNLGALGSRRRQFKQVTGSPFMKYINLYRIQRAQAPLTNTERQLKTEIPLEVLGNIE